MDSKQGDQTNTKHLQPHNFCYICIRLPFSVSLLAQLKLLAEVLMYGKQSSHMNHSVGKGTKRSPDL